MSARRRSMLFMGVFVLLWAAVEALAAQVLRGYSPYQVVFTRYAVHLALMLALWGWREPLSLVRTRRPVFQLARSLLMLAMPASWIISRESGVDPRALMTIFWLSPLFILVFGVVLLRERVPLAVWAVTALGWAGAVVMIAPAAVAPGPRLIFPLAMALSFSLYVAMTRSLRTETTRANLFYTAFGVAAALAVFLPRLWVTPSPRDLAVMAAVGVLGYVGLYGVDRMTAIAPVHASAPFAYLQLAFTAAIDVGLHHDRPGVRALAGLGVMGAAALYHWTREPRLAMEAAPA